MATSAGRLSFQCRRASCKSIIHYFVSSRMSVLTSLCILSLLSQGTAKKVSVPAPWGPMTRPLLIGHRGGANAFAPEHSIASYLSGIAHGADVSECDVCWSKDLLPICRHDAFLSTTTDALKVFPDKVMTVSLDGHNYTDVWTWDLTLAELKSLRLYQNTEEPATDRTHQYDGLFQIVTLEEHIQLVQSADRTIGIIPEIKHSSHHNKLDIFKKANTTTMQLLLKVLTNHGYKGPANSPEWRAKPVWIQSFEQNDLVWLATQTCIPLAQLIEGAGSVTVDRGTAFEDLVSDESLNRMAKHISVFAPWKFSMATFSSSNASAPVLDTGLGARAQQQGMVVTPYTFRPERNQMAPVFKGVWYDEYEYFLRNLSADGLWCDAVITAADYLSMEAIVGHGWSPDLATRLNHMPVPCKYPDREDIELAKLQYPELFDD